MDDENLSILDDNYDKVPEFESEEDQIAWEQDKAESEKFDKEFKELWKERLEKEKAQIFTYTFNDKIIRYERNMHQSENEFIILDPKTAVMSRFYTDKENKPKVSKMSYHSDSNDWKINYKIDSFESETKIILGYECYKMIVEQERINEKENWNIKNIYEIFVTEELNLPVRLVIPLWRPVLDLCALEIKTTNLETPNSYQIERAFEIEKGIDEKEIQLPNIFKNVK